LTYEDYASSSSFMKSQSAEVLTLKKAENLQGGGRETFCLYENIISKFVDKFNIYYKKWLLVHLK